MLSHTLLAPVCVCVCVVSHDGYSRTRCSLSLSLSLSHTHTQWNSTNPAVVKRWRELRWSAVKTIAFNHIVLGPAMGYFGYQGAVDWGLHMGVDTFPSWLTSMWQITLFMVIDDTMFYWGHRLLHHKRIYKHIHKLHHSFYQPVGVASLYSHPIEVILTNTIPFMTGPILVGAHMSTTWMWLILRICETVDGHCGYDFSWSPYRLLPFSGDSAHHDFHHSHNKGNFGSFVRPSLSLSLFHSTFTRGLLEQYTVCRNRACPVPPILALTPYYVHTSTFVQFTWWDKIGGTDKPFEEWAATNPYAQPPPPFFVEWVQTNVFGMAVRSAKKSAVRI